MQVENQLQQFDKLAADITIEVQPILSLKVSDDTSAIAIRASGKNVKAHAKKVEELRVELVRPLNEEVKRINEYAKKITAPLDQAEKHVKAELVAWEKELEKKRAEEYKRAEEERKRKEDEARAKLLAEKESNEIAAAFLEDPNQSVKNTIVATVTAEREVTEARKEFASNVADIQSMKVSGARRRWIFEVEDAAKVPRNFLIVDEKAIRAAIAEGAREIAGVRIFQETSVAL